MTIKKPLSFASAIVAGVIHCAQGSGFALYEPSAVSHAMGGALVGKAMDASANFNNPATLTDLTNITISVGFVTEHPRGDVQVNGHKFDMDPGPFILPHFQLAMPLSWGFTFGLGISPEYGLGTEYGRNWAMRWSTIKTTVEGLVVTPNLAYKLTDDWSIGVGLRWLYFSFEQNSYPAALMELPDELHLKGDNGWSDVGWQIGTKYDILDNLSVGVVYKAAIDTRVKGRSRVNGNNLRSAYDGDADADLTLPQSISAGLNWDITKRWHFGTAVSWTQWSEIDTLLFNLNDNPSPRELKWHDTWRISAGVAYDISDDLTAMLSYVYDMDCTDEEQASAMLPPADRHILGAGITWRAWRGLELTLSYSCIFMDGGSMATYDSLTKKGPFRLDTQEGFCHAGGFSITYRF